MQQELTTAVGPANHKAGALFFFLYGKNALLGLPSLVGGRAQCLDKASPALGSPYRRATTFRSEFCYQSDSPCSSMISKSPSAIWSQILLGWTGSRGLATSFSFNFERFTMATKRWLAVENGPTSCSHNSMSSKTLERSATHSAKSLREPAWRT